MDLLALDDDDFRRQWNGLGRAGRDALPPEIRAAGFDRYVSMLSGEPVDAAAREAAWNAADLPPEPGTPPSPRKTNGKHPDTPHGVSAADHTTAESVGVVSRRMSDVQMRPVRWLWKGKLACGKISLIQGDPGLGKSMILASLASIVTRGGTWPITRDKSPLGNVIILSAEDDPEDTLAPRLEAAGADLSRVHIVEAIKTIDERGQAFTRGFDLSQDVNRLIIKMREVGDVRLVSIDPVLAYVGQTKDSHKTSDVRGILAPLNVAAYDAAAAIVLVNHMNKSIGQSAINRGQGSNAWTAAARAVFGVIAEKENKTRRFFATIKNNLGADGADTNLAYSIEGYQLPGSDPEIVTARILWDATPVTQSTEELFRQNDLADGEKNDTTDALEYLAEVLSSGPMKVEDLATASRKAGHNWPTIKKCKQILKIASRRVGFGKGSYVEWMLKDAKPTSYASRDD